MLKFIFMTMAVFSTALFIGNIVGDIGSAMTWRTSLSLDGGDNPKDIQDKFSKFRIVISFIMAISWGIVSIL